MARRKETWQGAGKAWQAWEKRGKAREKRSKAREKRGKARRNRGKARRNRGKAREMVYCRRSEVSWCLGVSLSGRHAGATLGREAPLSLPPLPAPPLPAPPPNLWFGGADN